MKEYRHELAATGHRRGRRSGHAGSKSPRRPNRPAGLSNRSRPPPARPTLARRQRPPARAAASDVRPRGRVRQACWVPLLAYPAVRRTRLGKPTVAPHKLPQAGKPGRPVRWPQKPLAHRRDKAFLAALPGTSTESSRTKKGPDRRLSPSRREAGAPPHHGAPGGRSSLPARRPPTKEAAGSWQTKP